MKSEKRQLLTETLTAGAFILALAVNALANLLPLAGVTTGEAADRYPNLFAPAAATFSIWGLIYLLLSAHVLYMLGIFHTAEPVRSALLQRVEPLFALSSILNAAWMCAWHFDLIFLSTAVMLGLLACLARIALLLDRETLSRAEQLWVRLPLSLYFGWITVATAANFTVLLVSIGWNGFGLAPEVWTVLLILAAALIGMTAMLRFHSAAYGFALIWAYAGILFRHFSASGFAGAYPAAGAAAAACILLFLGGMVYLVRKRSV